MEDLRTEIEALGEDRPKLVILLKTLGLGLLNKNQHKIFLRRPDHGSFPVLHHAAFWAPKLVGGHLLTGMTILQVQSQTIKLAHMVIHLASRDQTALYWEPDSESSLVQNSYFDSEFSPLQNSYLILIALGTDMFPVGALRPFEPWDVIEMGLVGSLHDKPDRPLNHAEQSFLAAKLERQYLKLRIFLPIACAEVDLCVEGDLFPIFGKLSDEQQERVVINNGILRDNFPALRKSRHRTPLFLITLYLEVVDNASRPLSDLFVWGLWPVGVLVKKYLMELFQDPNIAPVEMCMVLAALLALSDTYFLGRKMTSHRGECPMDSPYQRPPISKFYEWVEQPSDTHWGWDVIETLICSFVAVFTNPRDGPAIPAIHQFFDGIQPEIDGSRIPETYYIYWRRRRIRMVGVGEEVIGTVDSKAISIKDLMNVTKYMGLARGQCVSQSIIDAESVTMIERDEEPPPAYLSSSSSDSLDMREEVSEADIRKTPQGKQREEPSQTLYRGRTQCNPKGQNQSPTEKTWRGRLVSAFRVTFGS